VMLNLTSPSQRAQIAARFQHRAKVMAIKRLLERDGDFVPRGVTAAPPHVIPDPVDRFTFVKGVTVILIRFMPSRQPELPQPSRHGPKSYRRLSLQS
jgi:hypothetical protein